MKATGIVRRIDDLGRIVIPKEMRKTLRLRVGDPLEISTDGGLLFLKKYSPLKSLKTYGTDVCECLYQLTQKAVILTDTEQIIAVKGQSDRQVGMDLSSDIDRVILERKSLHVDQKQGVGLRKIVENDNLDFTSQLIVPLVANGDALGSIILLNFDEEKEITAEDVKLTRFCEEFISRQFE